MNTPVLERQTRVADDVADGAGDEDLAGIGPCGNRGGGLERRAGEDAVFDRTLARVQSGADRYPKTLGSLRQRGRAADRARRAVERGDESFPLGGDDPP